MNYIEILGRSFPDVHAYCVGDPENIDDVILEEGSVMPTMEQFITADRTHRQQKKWLEIRDERDRRYYQGVHLDGVDGELYWFWTDLDTRGKYSMYDIMIRNNSVGQDTVLDDWKTMSGVFTPMTVRQLYRVITAATMNEKVIFNTGESKNAEMMLLENPDDYDVSTGWPVCYSDTLVS